MFSINYFYQFCKYFFFFRVTNKLFVFNFVLRAYQCNVFIVIINNLCDVNKNLLNFITYSVGIVF